MNTIFENWRIDLLYEEWLKNRPLNEGQSKFTLAQAADKLGINQDADAKTAKKAFRKLAMRYHPDRNDDPEAEQKFKDAAEAYAVFKGDETPAPVSGGGQAQGSTTPEPSGDKSKLYNTIIQAMGKAFASPQAAVAEGKQNK